MRPRRCRSGSRTLEAHRLIAAARPRSTRAYAPRSPERRCATSGRDRARHRGERLSRRPGAHRTRHRSRLHEAPTVYNWPSPGATRRLTAGLVLTIEPMIVAGGRILPGPGRLDDPHHRRSPLRARGAHDRRRRRAGRSCSPPPAETSTPARRERARRKRERDLRAAAGAVRRGARPPCARAIASTSARPRPAAPRARDSSARLKRSNACGEEVRREAGALVAHAELERADLAARLEPDGARAVAERVVDEVAERLLEPQPVAGELEPPARRPRAGARPRPRARRTGARPSRAARAPRPLRVSRSSPSSDAREHEQVVGEQREPVGLLGRGARRGPQLVGATRPPQRQLELGLQQRERRPQLVARLGDEAALALEPGLEPGEHLVQRSREPAISSSRRRDGKPLRPAAAPRSPPRGGASPRPAAAPRRRAA